MLLESLSFVTNLFFDWAMVLQFLVVLVILWNRDTVLRNTTEGKHGAPHTALIAVHTTLTILTFIFGTAREAYGMETAMTDFNPTPSTIEGILRDYQHRILVSDRLSYVFTTFVILMVADVAVTVALVSLAWRKAGLSDQVG
jgi:hypothetical protein